MEKVIAVFGIAIAAALLICVVMILGTFLGGVAGVVIGWAFPFVTDTLRDLFGVNLTNFQIGATLGFFGSAFRSSSFNKD